MPSDPEHPMEAWLKGYARQRNKEAGHDLGIPPATRRFLQEEVARHHGPKPARPAVSWWESRSSLLPRLGFALAMLLLLGILTFLIFPRKETPMETVSLQQKSPPPEAPQAPGKSALKMRSQELPTPEPDRNSEGTATGLAQEPPSRERSQLPPEAVALADADASPPPVPAPAPSQALSRSTPTPDSGATAQSAPATPGAAPAASSLASLRMAAPAPIPKTAPSWTFVREADAAADQAPPKPPPPSLHRFEFQMATNTIVVREVDGSLYTGSWKDATGRNVASGSLPALVSFEVQGTNEALRTLVTFRGNATQVQTTETGGVEWMMEGVATWGTTNRSVIRARSVPR